MADKANDKKRIFGCKKRNVSFEGKVHPLIAIDAMSFEDF